MRSTATRDIRQARLFRDAIALEWYKLRDQLKPVRSGSRVEQILDELRGIGKQAKGHTAHTIELPRSSAGLPFSSGDAGSVHSAIQ